MGLFSKIFDTEKYCSICGISNRLKIMHRLRDGLCCYNCNKLLSPFFTDLNYSTVEDIKRQIYLRNVNYQSLQTFHPTRKIGYNSYLLLDENTGKFCVITSEPIENNNYDILPCASVINCVIDTHETSEEVKYCDSNGRTKSFVPSYFAYSYDIYVIIELNHPYIRRISIKINESPINNNQPTLIDMHGGLLSKFTDALLPTKSYNGKTSNADEVKSSANYQMSINTALDIKNTLLYFRSAVQKLQSNTPQMMACPWCGSHVVINQDRTCKNCGGRLDAQ